MGKNFINFTTFLFQICKISTDIFYFYVKLIKFLAIKFHKKDRQ